MSPPPQASPELYSQEGGLEADDSNFTEDGASTYCSETTSVTSSVFHYQYENGRRYHGYRAGKYVLPNDEMEQDRLDVQHHLWNLHFGGKLFFAPLKEEKIERVLDIGTGTGIWAMDVGDMLPNAKEIIGTDLSPIQPTWVPPNVKFQIDDLSEEVWTFEENYFDLIHCRQLVGAVKDWDRFFRQIYTHLKPGGYIEIHDYETHELFCDDGTYKYESALAEYYRNIEAGMKKLGLFITWDSAPDRLRAAGFENVSVTKIKCPISPWAKDPKKKEQGAISLSTIEVALESYGLALFTRVLGMAESEAKDLMARALKDANNMRIHPYARAHIIYARKPVNAC